MAIGLFVFRRDLRIEDNTGLIKLLKQCTSVYTLFILDKRQISKKENKYFSATAFNFMLESLFELRKTLPQLCMLIGNPAKIISKFVKEHKVDIVCMNKDYTPFSLKRDKEITDIVKNVIFVDDYYLNEPTKIKAYKIFTPYYNFATKNYGVRKIDKFINKKKLLNARVKSIDLEKLIHNNLKLIKAQGTLPNLMQHGGRANGLERLAKFKCSEYSSGRDQLMFETSRLSPHLKFGTISIREAYYSCKDAVFRKELYWRDFYAQVGYYFPNVFKGNFRDMGKKIWWENDMTKFHEWCNGETSVPIINACMNQLNKSGYMHNRGRMLVAYYLTRVLHIDWRYGEKYFATRLTDYDPFSNNGGWQWAAGTGADAMPLFRTFNMERQAKKYDKDGEYVQTWI